MKKTFLICSLSGRLEGLIKLIMSLNEFSDEWHLALVLQMYSAQEQAIIEVASKKVFGDNVVIFSTNEMTGPHVARCVALDNMTSDVWCVLDDDMWAVSGMTKYDNMAEILMNERNIGLLSANWRRNESMLKKVVLSDNLIKQDIVYTGGGMCFRQDLADIIKDIPRTMYVFDNPLWSIYSYVNGYDNYRYMGCAAVHNICTKGGRIKWLKENDKNKELPPKEWIRTRKGTGGKGSNNEFLICDSSDITDLAKKLHKENKK